MATSVLDLSPAEREELERRLRLRTGRAEDARRARMILAIDRGDSYTEIAGALACNRNYISRWKERFVADRLAGLYSRNLGRAVSDKTPKLEAKILAWTLKRKPRDGSTHWSTRRLAKELSVNHMMVARVWARAGVQPHRLEHYQVSNDPDFEKKAADIIGLYLQPPEHAAVFCVDEKTAIQALDRTDPVLPLSPGRAERHGFEYYRHGTLSLYDALEVGTGHVEGRTVARHSSVEFLAFLDQLVAAHPRRRAIHLIADNFAAHKTKAVAAWLAAHPRVALHFTPTYSSWLNQIELWFAKIERDCLARGIFTSTADLRRKLMQYIRAHNKTCRPFRWAYTNPKHRIRAIGKRETVH